MSLVSSQRVDESLHRIGWNDRRSSEVVLRRARSQVSALPFARSDARLESEKVVEGTQEDRARWVFHALACLPSGREFGRRLTSYPTLAMPEFRIKWSQYRLNADSPHEGVKKLAAALKRDPAFFFTLEDASLYDSRRPVWRRIFFG